MMVRLTLPWPPSVNRLWRSYRGRNILSKEGRDYYEQAKAVVLTQRGGAHWPLQGPLSLRVECYPPDRRRRDLSNLLKAPEDLLTKCGVWEDDSQLDLITIRRREPCKGGRLEVEVMPL